MMGGWEDGRTILMYDERYYRFILDRSIDRSIRSPSQYLFNILPLKFMILESSDVYIYYEYYYIGY